MNYCKKCGAPINDGSSFCKACGTYVYAAETFERNDPYRQRGLVESRNVVLAVILSVITCGIYYLFWIYKLNDEIHCLTGEKGYTSGGLVILFTFLSCGLYLLYWMYQMGDRCSRLTGESGESNAVLCLLFCACGFGIISCAMMQNTVNRIVI